MDIHVKRQQEGSHLRAKERPPRNLPCQCLDQPPELREKIIIPVAQAALSVVSRFQQLQDTLSPEEAWGSFTLPWLSSSLRL